MIDAAIDLMRRSGLAGAGINEVIRESGAPKGSLYHFFPDGKAQLASEALQTYSRRVLAFLDAALASAKTPQGRIKALFEAFAQRIETADFLASCAAGAVTLDLEADVDSLRPVIAEMFSEWVELIARRLDFADARRARSFAGLVLTAIEGAYIRGRAERSGTPFREAGAWLARLAESEGMAR